MVGDVESHLYVRDAGLAGRSPLQHHRLIWRQRNGAIADKLERQQRVAEAKDKALAELCGDDTPAEEVEKIKALLKAVEKKLVRGRILAGQPRIDGRDTRSVRPITVRTGVLPRTHGSALFTRG